MQPIVRPALDPLAHKAAIDALEAQRSAYRRFARTVTTHTATLNDGDGDKAVAVASATVRGFGELEQGTQALEPLVREVHESGSDDQQLEMQRRMEDLMREAQQAETAIHNLSLQLEAWRNAYGRQLAESGLVPGGDRGGDPDGGGTGGAPAGPTPGARVHPYARAGLGVRSPDRRAPSLIDRKG